MNVKGHGLTEAEAQARLAAGQDNTTSLKALRTWELTRRESIFTVFNLNMVALGIIEVLMKQWVSALLTLLMLGLTTAIRVVQARIAHQRIQKVQQITRPRSTVIRDGRTKSIDSNQIVPGDLLVIGPGDQFQVDGQIVGTGSILVDTSVITGQRGWQRVGPGDPVAAGTYCVSGRGTFVAQKVGKDRLIHSRLAQRTSLAATPTSLERLISRILSVLFFVVMVYAVVLLAKFFRLDVGASVDVLVDAAPVIFSLLPTGLYLMIVSTYATGTANLAEMGALVPSARSVESMAGSDIICFTDIALLAGTSMELIPLARPDAESDWPSASQMRQTLGDFVRSLSSSSPISEVLTRSFEGERRVLRTEEAHLAALGWTAVAFDDPDDPYVYVMAEPRVFTELGTALPTWAEAAADGPPEDGSLADLLILARGSAATWLAELTADPRLPEDLVPLCAVQYRKRLRSDTLEVIRGFNEAGMLIRVFALDEPWVAISALRQAGLPEEAADRYLANGGMSREELERIPRTRWPQVIEDYRLFGGLHPDQVGDLIRLMRQSGKYVTVVGDGIADLPALREADLAVVQSASTQAALGLADIVLLENSPAALMKVLHRGQAIVRGLLDVIKLNLTMVLCSALLIIDVRMISTGFPYVSGQGTAISILAVTIPSLLLPFWAARGTLPSASYRAILIRFVVPAGGLMSVTGFLVYLYVLSSGGQVVAQRAVAYTLLYCGLLLTVLIKPPLRTRAPLVPGGQPRRDWRTVWLAGGLAIVGTGIPVVPLGRQLFRLDVLPHFADYGAVALGVIGWVVAVHLIWLIFPRVDIPRPTWRVAATHDTASRAG